MLTTDLIPSFIEIKVMEKGREEGLKKARQQDILDALDARFGTVSEGTRAVFLSITEENRSRNAHRLAITTPNLQHFLENA